MNGRQAIFGAFLGSIAIITWRDFTNRDPDWPLPVPPPYRYVGAAVAFGLLSLTAEFVNEKVPAVLAIGLLVGLGFQTAQGGRKHYTPPPGVGESVGGALGKGLEQLGGANRYFEPRNRKTN